MSWVELRVIEQLKYETIKKLFEDGPDPRKKKRAALKMGCAVRTKEADYPVKKGNGGSPSWKHKTAPVICDK